MNSPVATVRVVEEVEELRDYLLKDPIGRAYQLGDLDSAHFPYATWYGAGVEDSLETLVLVYTGLSLPVLISSGTTDGMRSILEAYSDDLPRRVMLHMQPEHLEAFGGALADHPLRPMVRMGMSLENFRPKESSETLEIKQLSMGDIGEIMNLFGFYPDNFFEPAQLSTGHYYGIRSGGSLVSVAGVHVFSPQVRVACLGNIVTHPEYRGRGFSTHCTSYLCSQLAKAGIDLFALNVERSNSSAVRVYRKLGFEEHATYLEGEVSTLLQARR
jgi:ribosomal protein S18 acetylase RimI-like enzyme